MQQLAFNMIFHHLQRYSYPPGPWAQFIPYARPSQPWEFGDGYVFKDNS